MISWLLFATNIVAAFLMLRFGKREEKAVIWVATAYIALPPLVYGLQIGTFRYGVFALEMVLLYTLLVTALRIDRWWSIAATGAQALACLTHIVPLAMVDVYVWSTVTIRIWLWAVVSFLLLAGAWETWAHSALTIKGMGNGKRVEVRKRVRNLEKMASCGMRERSPRRRPYSS